MPCSKRLVSMTRRRGTGVREPVRGRVWRTAAVAAALLVLSSVLVGCDATDSTDDHPSTFAVDDFESGAIDGWQAVGSGSGGWFVYSDGLEAPDPDQSDPNMPFDVPDPPQGKYRGGDGHVEPRDAHPLPGREAGRALQALSVRVLRRARRIQQPRHPGPRCARARTSSSGSISLDPSAPIDSVAKGDVLVNVFRTSPSDSTTREPTEVSVDLSRWAGQTVRLRLAADRQPRAAAGRRGRHPSRADRSGRRQPCRASRHSGGDECSRPRPAPDDRDGSAGGALRPCREARAERPVLRRRARRSERRGPAPGRLGPRRPGGRHPEHARHEVPDRLDEQDVHRGRDAAARRGGQARAGRHPRRAFARLSERGRGVEGHRAAPPHPHRGHGRHLRTGVRAEPLESARSSTTT